MLIREAFQKNAEDQRFLTALSEEYPDARFSGARWFSARLDPVDCDVVSLEKDTHWTLTLFIGRQLPGGVVYVHPSGPHRIDKGVPMLMGPDNKSHLRNVLLEWAKGNRRPPP